MQILENTRSIFLTYKEAQQLITFFKEAKRAAPLVEERRISTYLLDELSYVRDIDYFPLRDSIHCSRSSRFMRIEFPMRISRDPGIFPPSTY